jgi:hypothetical protein
MSDVLSVGFGVGCAAVLGCVFELLRIKFRGSAATGIWANTAVASAAALMMVGLLFFLAAMTLGRIMIVIDDPAWAITAGMVAYIGAFIIGLGVIRTVLGSRTQRPA